MFISRGKIYPKSVSSENTRFLSYFQTVANAIKADILGIAMLIIKF